MNTTGPLSADLDRHPFSPLPSKAAGSGEALACAPIDARRPCTAVDQAVDALILYLAELAGVTPAEALAAVQEGRVQGDERTEHSPGDRVTRTPQGL